MDKTRSLGHKLTMENLRPSDNLCLIYENSDEQNECVFSFINAGLGQNERILYITTTENQTKILQFLDSKGLKTDNLIRQNQLFMLGNKASQNCIHSGFVELFDEQYKKTISLGFPGLRILIESNHYFNDPDQKENLLERIAITAAFLEDKNCILLCQYDKKLTDPGILFQVIKTHPILILGNEMFRNFYYIGASELRKDDAVQKEIEKWIQQLKDYKLYAASLQESERKLSTLIDNLPGAAYRCLNDRNYTMFFLSNGIKKLTGYNPKELINNKFLSYNDTIHPDDRRYVWETIQDAVKKKKPFQLTYRIIGKDGGETWIWEQGRLVDEYHNGTGILEGLLTDITEQKKIEKEALQAKQKAEESDRLKSAFLANMSHEIRTPLNGILGFTELISQDGISTEHKERYKNIINSSAQQLLTIINDILDISKIDSKQLKINKTSVNLGSIIDEVSEKTKFERRRLNKEHIDFILNIPPDFEETFIITDENRIKQILMNLLNNAFKFTFNGSVEFGYRFERSRKKGVEKNVVFFINDTGIGIPERTQKYIFERFRQAEGIPTKNPGGTGLGLSICKGLTDLLGGRIKLSSRPGEGTSVVVTFPMIFAEQEQDIPEFIEKYGNKLSGKKVLLVEDNEINRIFFSEVLKDRTKSLLIAKNGTEGLQILKNEKDIDLALIDIKLPDISGLEIIRKIKAMNKNIPVIAQTAYANASEIDKCYNAGCDAYLPKPINKGDLFIVINRLL